MFSNIWNTQQRPRVPTTRNQNDMRIQLFSHQLMSYLQIHRQIEDLMMNLDEIRLGLMDSVDLFAIQPGFRDYFNRLYSSRNLLTELNAVLNRGVYGRRFTSMGGVPTSSATYPPQPQYQTPNIPTNFVPTSDPHRNTTDSSLNYFAQQFSLPSLNTPARTHASSNQLADVLNRFLNTTVNVAHTNDQISRASRAIRFASIPNPLNETCPISLERFTENEDVIQLVQCGHIFTRHYFNQWFTSNVRCPICRHDIRQLTSTMPSQSSTNSLPYEPSSQSNSLNNTPNSGSENIINDDESSFDTEVDDQARQYQETNRFNLPSTNAPTVVDILLNLSEQLPPQLSSRDHNTIDDISFIYGISSDNLVRLLVDGITNNVDTSAVRNRQSNNDNQPDGGGSSASRSSRTE